MRGVMLLALAVVCGACGKADGKEKSAEPQVHEAACDKMYTSTTTYESEYTKANTTTQTTFVAVFSGVKLEPGARARADLLDYENLGDRPCGRNFSCTINKPPQAMAIVSMPVWVLQDGTPSIQCGSKTEEKDAEKTTVSGERWKRARLIVEP